MEKILVLVTSYDLSEYLFLKLSLRGGLNIIGSLALHLGIFDDGFEELLAAGKLSKVWSWYKKLELCMQTHRDHSIKLIDFDKVFDPLQWAHLPRNQIIGVNIHPAWVCRPNFGLVNISSREKIRFHARYQSSGILVKRLVERSEAEEVLKKI